MSNKKYFENITVKIGLIAKYFRVFRFLAIIAYLFYLGALMVNVFFAVEYIPSADEVKGKFLPVKAGNEAINSIESYFSAKQNNLGKNLLKTEGRNPFLPYENENPNSVKNIENSGTKIAD